ncbi:MAG: hypothetical protein IPO48_07295 [Saprospiraceae bacterium]|nr:hypothetical protein [Saprospiraceae bacterium]
MFTVTFVGQLIVGRVTSITITPNAVHISFISTISTTFTLPPAAASLQPKK